MYLKLKEECKDFHIGPQRETDISLSSQKGPGSTRTHHNMHSSTLVTRYNDWQKLLNVSTLVATQ